MGSFWLKLKAFVKVVLFSAVGLYLLAFAFNNHGPPVAVWVWFGTEWQSSMLTALAVSFLSGAVVTLLVRTTWVTWRQVRAMRRRAAEEKNQRREAELVSKAARLRTHPPDPGRADGSE